MIRLAKQHGSYGYKKVTKLLRIEGWRVNHKKIERLWKEEGLQLPQRHKNAGMAGPAAELITKAAAGP